jgi:hypothetical protein
VRACGGMPAVATASHEEVSQGVRRWLRRGGRGVMEQPAGASVRSSEAAGRALAEPLGAVQPEAEAPAREWASDRVSGWERDRALGQSRRKPSSARVPAPDRRLPHPQPRLQRPRQRWRPRGAPRDEGAPRHGDADARGRRRRVGGRSSRSTRPYLAMECTAGMSRKCRARTRFSKCVDILFKTMCRSASRASS